MIIVFLHDCVQYILSTRNIATYYSNLGKIFKHFTVLPFSRYTFASNTAQTEWLVTLITTMCWWRRKPLITLCWACPRKIPRAPASKKSWSWSKYLQKRDGSNRAACFVLLFRTFASYWFMSSHLLEKKPILWTILFLINCCTSILTHSQ